MLIKLINSKTQHIARVNFPGSINSILPNWFLEQIYNEVLDKEEKDIEELLEYKELDYYNVIEITEDDNG